MMTEKGDYCFAYKISSLLQKGNTVHALNIFTDNKYSEEIRTNAWDLVPIVAQFLTEQYEDNKNEVFKCCRKLIDVIAEKSKPEEVLLQFIEEIETAEDDVKFLALIKPIENVLLRVPDKRIISLGWCFNAIKCYLQQIPAPDSLNLTEEQRLLLDNDDTVNRILYLYSELECFCDTFINELLQASTGNILERKQVIGKFLVELLGNPLGFLHMDVYKSTKPRARILAEEIVWNICRIFPDPFLFLEMRGEIENRDLIKPDDMPLGILYFLLSENCIESLPKVYNRIYILQNSLIFVNTLLSQKNQFIVEKGVHLAANLLKNIEQLELPYLLLDLGDHSNFCKALSNVIIHNENETIRKKGLLSLQNYIWAFDHQGRHSVIINLVRNISHSGLKGNIITQYKEMITKEMRINDWKNFPKYYEGQKFFDMLEEFTKLKKKEETDIVDESDQIISTLNLLRYVLIADHTSNYTKIAYICSDLKIDYLAPLKKGIELSREHYVLKIKEITKKSNEKTADSGDCEISVNVSGQNLCEMPLQHKIEILNLSLTTLDVVDSILCRVVELIELMTGQ